MSVERRSTQQQLNASLREQVVIRKMYFNDLNKVMAVEEKAYPHPWTLGIFRDCLRVGYLAWVMELDDEIIGYTIVMQSPGEAHVLNICIHPDYQGRGLGRYFLRFVIAQMQQRQVEMLLLEVRRTNSVAQSLYASEGFHQLGVRKDYYPAGQGREDAIILARYLSERPEQ